MKPCCRDTVMILSAAAAVLPHPTAGRILASLERIKGRCDACDAVARDFDQTKRSEVTKEAHPSEVLHAFGCAIAYILEEA
jgi:hypothetical protein